MFTAIFMFNSNPLFQFPKMLKWYGKIISSKKLPMEVVQITVFKPAISEGPVAY